MRMQVLDGEREASSHSPTPTEKEDPGHADPSGHELVLQEKRWGECPGERRP